jgi:hypothetical protein
VSKLKALKIIIVIIVKIVIIFITSVKKSIFTLDIHVMVIKNTMLTW